MSEKNSYILIKNGIVTNAHEMLEDTDVLVCNEKILDVGKNLVAPTDGSIKVIDASGKYVFPGFIDPHVHMEMPFMGTHSKDDFYSGTAAAACGGTTMIIDFVNPMKGQTHYEAYQAYRKSADSKVVTDYALHCIITSFDDKVAADIKKMCCELQEVNSFKFFLAYKGALMVNDDQLCSAFDLCAKIGAVAQVHAENGELVAREQKRIFDLGITGPEGHALSRPPRYEGEATARAILLAHEQKCPLYVVHVMSKDALDAVVEAKQKGWRVIGEAIAAGMMLDDEKMYDPDWNIASRYVMSPPLRSKEHKFHIQNAIKCGTLDLIGTDHCVFDSAQRKMGINDFRKIPNGLNGVEDRPTLVWNLMVESGRISPSDFCRVMSTKAAKIFNIYGQKGVIQKGADADIAIMDPNAEKVISAKTHHQNLDYNVFEGMKVKGVVKTTISRGKIVFDNNQLYVEKGAGKFVATKPWSSEIYQNIHKENAYNEPIGVKREIVC